MNERHDEEKLEQLYWKFRHESDQTGEERLRFKGFMRAYADAQSSAQEPAEPAARHPDDEAVDRFAYAMKQKLALAREKGRSGWQQMNPAELSAMLREHVEKGDPRDVANFCMFLWHHGWLIESANKPAAQDLVNDALADDIEAIDIMHRGDPPYEHDGYYIRKKAADMVRNGYKLYTHHASEAAQPDFSDAYQGAREDAEIWKKRALEAEELNRKFIAQINDETFMGEPAQPVRKLIEKVDRLVEMDDAPPMSLGDWIDAWNEIKVAMGAVKVWQAAIAHRDAQTSAINEQILAELKNLVRAYVRLLEAGKDRIESLGGECDSVEYMENGDSSLRAAKTAIAAAEAHKGAA